MEPHHEVESPSPWVCRFAPLIVNGGRVLDLACGSGRHARYLAKLGLQVEAVDRDADAIERLTAVAGVTARVADLENGPWPFADCRFDAIIVVNYLHRPLFPHLLAALTAGGVLVYETFALGNARFGRPSNPNFLLKSGELLELVRGRLRVVAYEDGYVETPKPAMVQRLCAVNEELAG